MPATIIRVLGHVADQIPDDLAERAGELVEQVKANPVLLGILVVIGVITAVIFLFGVVKQSIKALLVGGALSAAAWFWFFNLR